mmetsp:Transcript_2435/g.3594  ORF Transcript_2435/g.3594 Transcript_2435/m.3594 type:complete len:474 (-) Transcript_2435:172-1593(-)
MMLLLLRRLLLMFFLCWCTHAQECTEGDAECAAADSCVDLHEKCLDWASVGKCSGEEENYSYYHETCPKSCRTCWSCDDENESCKMWADAGECESNALYMLNFCARSCDSCDEDGDDDDDDDDEEHDDYGVVQRLDYGPRAAEVAEAIEDMKLYFKTLREDPSTTKKLLEILDLCKLENSQCAYWKVIGECEKNPDYMKLQCAAVCHTCDNLDIAIRCPLDSDAPNAWEANDLHQFFVNITTLEEFQKYEPVIHSRPPNGEEEESSGTHGIGPWVVTLENFITPEEADHLIKLGAEEGYERSSDVGKMKADGTFEGKVSESRTSSNAWCQNSCYEDEIAQQVIGKITNLTYLPEENSEFLQLLKYDVGQYYVTHHDYIGADKDRQQGVRIATIFLYLSDVEEGGGTNFPRLNITVMPKKGRALIWPSVLDNKPHNKDSRTDHQALPVKAGVKYGANAWIHMRDFKTPNRENCM